MKRDTAAEAKEIIGLPCKVRVDIDIHEFGFGSAVAVFPVRILTVVRRKTERHGNPETDPPFGVNLVRDVKVRQELCFMLPVVCRSGIGSVFEFDNLVHGNTGHTELNLCTGQKDHGGRVVKGSGDVIARNAGACIRTTERHHGLFSELKARGESLRCCQRDST